MYISLSIRNQWRKSHKCTIFIFYEKYKKYMKLGDMNVND